MASERSSDGGTRLASSSSDEESKHKSIRKNGQFHNPWDTWRDIGFRTVMKWMITAKNNTNLPVNKRELEKALPIVEVEKVKQEMFRDVDPGRARATWIGHATVLVQMEKLNILTDPVFSTRCSPSQYLGTKRFRETPISIHDLPKIHAVLISHNHYDHLDYGTVQGINGRFGDVTRWFVPKGLASWMHSAGCHNVIELDWWQENCIPDQPDVRFIFTPAQHWSSRNGLDRNASLWGSWCVLGKETKFYFAGDTGYCSVFEHIGNRYGPFDLAAIPIGAYEPRWMMQCQHVDPEEAVQIHQDIRSKKSIGIHWGTFALANEYYLEPPEKLHQALTEKGLDVNSFITLKHGETLEFSGDNTNSLD